MGNPKGSPENLKPFTTDRDEPLIKRLNIRITESMDNELKELGEEKPDFVRKAIQKELDKRNADKSED